MTTNTVSANDALVSEVVSLFHESVLASDWEERRARLRAQAVAAFASHPECDREKCHAFVEKFIEAVDADRQLAH